MPGTVPWFESRYESSLAALRTRRVGQELKDELEQQTVGRNSLLETNEKAGSKAIRSTAEESQCSVAGGPGAGTVAFLRWCWRARGPGRLGLVRATLGG